MADEQSQEENQKLISPSLVKETKCPRLDLIFSSFSVSKDVKTADSELVKIQALLHDASAPLITMLYKLDPLVITEEEALTAVEGSIRLLGNASSNLSTLRRRKILKSVNPDIVNLARS